MTFTHRSYEPGQTVAAIATPPGEGGVAVIRISGDEALSVADKMFSGPVTSYATHTVRFGKIFNAEGKCIDEGLVIVMRAPRSYTGEDTVEIHCHGGSFVTREVLKAACLLGARPALPGEFTCKAFRNGKMDLTQAEAVRELIAAKSALAMEAAGNRLRGKLGNRITDFQERLIKALAILEAELDFPDEDLTVQDRTGTMLNGVLDGMEALLATFHDGKRLVTDLSVCLIGAPNAGKSSLMNALSGTKRAIVTEIPGTTRDTIEEEIRLAGWTFRLIDTAGLRIADDRIEKEGVARALQAAKEADVILFVVDVLASGFDTEVLTTFPQDRTVVVWNKIDLHPKFIAPDRGRNSVMISAKERIGIEGIGKAIDTLLWSKGVPPKEEVLLTSERHVQSLTQAIRGVQRALAGLKERLSPEFVTSDLRFALRELGTIIGIDVTEDVLSSVFSEFCIGK